MPGMAEELNPSPRPHHSTRERLWKIIFEAATRAGKIFDVLLLLAIGLSVVAVMLESFEAWDEADAAAGSFTVTLG